MNLFNGVILITNVSFLMFSVFAVAFVGFALGRITIKGVKLGTSGVFIIALLYGGLFSKHISSTISQKVDGKSVDYSSNALKVIENLGLVLFVGSVGFISGPTFFRNLKKNFISYIVLGVIIILFGSLTVVACFYIGKNSEEDKDEFVAMLVGLFSGALTSTPAFSAAKTTADPKYENAVTVGHGIAYLFGVIGVVLFVQIVPKIVRADMEVERGLIVQADSKKKDVKKEEENTDEKEEKDTKNKEKTEEEVRDPPTFFMDPFGFCVFGAAAIIGIFLGAIRIPLSSKLLDGTTFSFTTTGGVLIVCLVIGHFGRICKLSLTIEKRILEVLRELGLMLFLIGAGISGGTKFIDYFKGIYFAYGIFMTLIPMIIGFVFGKWVFKLCLLNNLGSLTGGMTSTPALGTLISVAGTDDVAGAYAATYPISLICIVLASQFLVLLLN